MQCFLFIFRFVQWNRDREGDVRKLFVVLHAVDISGVLFVTEDASQIKVTTL